MINDNTKEMQVALLDTKNKMETKYKEGIIDDVLDELRYFLQSYLLF